MKSIIFYAHQLLLTLSGQPSFFSSKRIERFVVFTSAITGYNAYIWTRMWATTFTATEFMVVTGGFLAYAGFNIIQGQKDLPIKDNSETNDKTTPPTP